MLMAYYWITQGYRRTPFPWHANRYLYWSNIILLLILGDLLSIFSISWLYLAGYLLKLVAVALVLNRLFSSHTQQRIQTAPQSSLFIRHKFYI